MTKSNVKSKSPESVAAGGSVWPQVVIDRLTRVDSNLPQALAHVWLLVIPLLAVTGSVFVFVYASSVPGTGTVIGSGLMFGAAAFLAGGLVGFLFGLPNVLAGTSTNTSLEQISTWLATIIVGLTLTQLGRIPDVLGKLADDLKAPLGGQDSSAQFGLALIIFYTALGFLFVYLWTRTLATTELDAVDTPDGATPDADTKAATTPDGATPDADTKAATTPDGATPDADTKAATTPDGATPDADTKAATTPDGDTPDGV